MESGAVTHRVFTTLSFCLSTQTVLCSQAEGTSFRNQELLSHFFNGVNNDGTPSQGLTYKRIYFSCAQKKNLEHNLNRTMIEAMRLFDRNPFIPPWRVSCIVCTAAEDASPQRLSASYNFVWLTCLHSAPRLIFRCVKLHIDRNRQIPSAICKGEFFRESRVTSVSPFLWRRDS